MALTYEPIATYTTSGNQASVTFSSIPSTYTDLVLVIGNLKHSFSGTGGVYDSFALFNNDSGSNYSFILLEGDGSTAFSEIKTNKTSFQTNYSRSGDAPGNIIWHIQNYANTNVYKTSLLRSNTPSVVTAQVNLWNSTSAITTITCAPTNIYYWVDGAVFTLYGIKAA